MTSHALLDDTTAQVCVDLAALGSPDSVCECRIIDPLAAREAGKGSGFEYPHDPPNS